MKTISLENVLLAIVMGLQAWTLSSVVDVRERVARLEARQDLYAPRRPAAAADLPLEGPLVTRPQAIADRRE
jgi:hypothetical protein